MRLASKAQRNGKPQQQPILTIRQLLCLYAIQALGVDHASPMAIGMVVHVSCDNYYLPFATGGIYMSLNRMYELGYAERYQEEGDRRTYWKVTVRGKSAIERTIGHIRTMESLSHNQSKKIAEDHRMRKERAAA